MNVMDEIHAIFRRRGAAAYFGECVSMTEHSLQTAILCTDGRCAAGPWSSPRCCTMSGISSIMYPATSPTGPTTHTTSASAPGGWPGAFERRCRNP